MIHNRNLDLELTKFQENADNRLQQYLGHTAQMQQIRYRIGMRLHTAGHRLKQNRLKHFFERKFQVAFVGKRQIAKDAHFRIECTVEIANETLEATL